LIELRCFFSQIRWVKFCATLADILLYRFKLEDGFSETSGKKGRTFKMQQQAVPFHQVLQALSFFQGPEMTFFVASEYPLYLKK